MMGSFIPWECAVGDVLYNEAKLYSKRERERVESIVGVREIGYLTRTPPSTTPS